MKVSKELKDEIGNAFAAYSNILFSASIGAKVPKNFQKLLDCSSEEIHHKVAILKEFYETLEIE